MAETKTLHFNIQNKMSFSELDAKLKAENIVYDSYTALFKGTAFYRYDPSRGTKPDGSFYFEKTANNGKDATPIANPYYVAEEEVVAEVPETTVENAVEEPVADDKAAVEETVAEPETPVTDENKGVSEEVVAELEAKNDELTAKMAELQSAFEAKEAEANKLETEITKLQETLNGAMEELKSRDDIIREQQASLNAKDKSTDISATDIVGLCAAIKALGFEVELKYCGVKNVEEAAGVPEIEIQ